MSTFVLLVLFFLGGCVGVELFKGGGVACGCALCNQLGGGGGVCSTSRAA
jgi:hypothetical protein